MCICSRVDLFSHLVLRWCELEQKLYRQYHVLIWNDYEHNKTHLLESVKIGWTSDTVIHWKDQYSRKCYKITLSEDQPVLVDDGYQVTHVSCRRYAVSCQHWSLFTCIDKQTAHTQAYRNQYCHVHMQYRRISLNIRTHCYHSVFHCHDVIKLELSRSMGEYYISDYWVKEHAPSCVQNALFNTITQFGETEY